MQAVPSRGLRVTGIFRVSKVNIPLKPPLEPGAKNWKGRPRGVGACAICVGAMTSGNAKFGNF